MSDKVVYFIRPIGLAGPVKIGCSVAAVFRLNAIQPWSPMLLEVAATVPGDFALERLIHNCFADAHSHGEWFLPVPRLVQAIEKIAAGALVGDAIDLTDVRGDIRADNYRKRGELLHARAVEHRERWFPEGVKSSETVQ